MNPLTPARVHPEREIPDPVIPAERVRVRTIDRRLDHPALGRLRLLLGQRFFVLRAAVYGVVAATVLAFLIPVQFEARTQLMPPDSEFSSGLASLLAMSARGGSGLGMLAGDMLGLKTSGALFIGILRSDTVEERIIDKFDLKKVYGVKRMQDARRRLEQNTQISEDRKSGIIALGVTDHDPARAAAIAQAYIVELDRLVVELNTSAARRERVFLEERLKTVKLDLDASAREFSQFASKNSAIDIKEQGRAMVEAAATLQGHLIAAQSELEGLRQIYADSNVRVKAVRARIEELQKKLEQMGDGDLAPAGDQRPSLYPSIRKLPLLGVTYAELYRSNKIQETVFELLTQQCELAKVQEAKETPSVKVLDAAKPPEKKSFPPRLLIMFLGGFFASVMASVWVLGESRWNELDESHPGKALAREALSMFRSDIQLASNHSALRGMREKLSWRRRA